MIEKNQNRVVYSYNTFTIETLYKIDLPGCVFSSSIIKNKYIGYVIDHNNFDIKSLSGFGYLEIISEGNTNTETSRSNVIRFDNKSIIHRSYILNYELVYESVLGRIVLITVGLDKRIKVYLTDKLIGEM
mmetsp:Transcript_24898/g.25987  ORF Transcript_24898/g.25987 Transcript_24898/m.25987 type:complete len:130 (+) Transcript_24898:1-390(+)